MRRPHPYLAIALVCAAVLLVTLVLAGTARSEVEVVPVGPRGPVPTGTGCLPYVNSQIVWPGSSQCSPWTAQLNVPSENRLGAIRYFTVRQIEIDLGTGALTSPLPWYERNTAIGEAFDLEPMFFDRGIYGVYVTPPGWTPNCDGGSWCGCVSGVGSWPPRVDASRPAGHVEQLVSWEITNAVLGRLNRSDLWDGDYVSSVVTRVGQQMGGWSQ